MKKIAISLIVLALFSYCDRSPSTGAESTVVDSASMQLIDRERVKAFWDAYRQAQKAKATGDWAGAAGWYQKALDIDSVHLDSWFNLGNMHLELRQYKEAERCWRKVTTFNDITAKAHMQLGRLYMSYDRPEVFDMKKAREEFMKSAAINIVITGPQMQLGHLDMLEGNIESAKSHYEKVVGSDAKNIEALFLLAYLNWKSGKEAEAIVYFNKSLEYSTPEKAVNNVASEGDTKDGKSHVRPINISFFIDCIKSMDTIDKENFRPTMKERFACVDARLATINGSIVQ